MLGFLDDGDTSRGRLILISCPSSSASGMGRLKWRWQRGFTITTLLGLSVQQTRDIEMRYFHDFAVNQPASVPLGF
eukprot:scaffold82950_cov58-Cyclotella_meneghiniana.AAC.2